MAYVVLYIAAITAALWQHGHPILTLTLMGLAPLLAILAYVPYRILRSGVRFLLQLLLVAGAGIWLLYRIEQGEMLDKSVVELLAITGLCFLMAQAAREYGYLLIICIILLLYGTLLPRGALLGSMFAALITLLFLLYGNRVRSLAGHHGVAPPGKVLRRNWHFMLLHMGLALGGFYLIFALLPTRAVSTRGLVEVSFFHDKESMLPPDMRQWMKSANVKKDATGEKIVRGEKPDSIGSTGAPLPVKNTQKAPSNISGPGGSAPPGDRLLFRVKSSVKLYHLAQLYDTYEGQEWKSSPKLQSARLRRTPKGNHSEYIQEDITQVYTIQHWISPKLYAAYLPLAFEMDARHSNVLLQSTFYNASLAQDAYPAPPFRYQATSLILVPVRRPDLPPPEENAPPIDLWIEGLARGHYRQLPAKAISKRLRQLVKDITAGIEDDYAKAIKLRDHLRNNFAYEQYSKAPPEDRETVDYFIFELRKGHCEYFASALAVMARLAGLPARVATGFSPGDYNTLNNTFEVYEKHAHAWTQIFVEQYGWLTMDATPPGAVESRTTPVGIGQFRDPFGNQWRVTPPELTERTLETIKETYLRRLREDSNDHAMKKGSEKLAEAEASLREQLGKAYKKIEKDAAKNRAETADLRARLQQLGKEIGDISRTALAFLRRHHWALSPFLVIGVAGVLFYRQFRYRRRKKRQQQECAAHFERAAATYSGAEYRASILAAYRACRIQLELAEAPRCHNEELLDYVERLGNVNARFPGLLRPVILAFYRAAYSDETMDRATALNTLRRAYTLRRILVPRETPHAETPRKRSIKGIATAVIGGIVLLFFVLFAADRTVEQCMGRVQNRCENIEMRPVGLLLGTNPHVRGKENPYFTHRIVAAAELYHAQKISKIIVSGDNGRKEYNEPEAMRQALLKKGVAEKDIFLDYAGFRTLDSVIRAKAIFGQTRLTIISQPFHCARAIFLARTHGIDAIGYGAQNVHYDRKRNALRETPARLLAVLDATFRRGPRFLGPSINMQ